MGSQRRKRVEEAFESSDEDEELAIVEFNANGDQEILDFDAQGPSKLKKMVHFNADGQPVGETSVSFGTYLGSVARKHCPISYEHWKDVPDQIKEIIWKLVVDEYIVPRSYKKQILQRINKHWREFKSKLRSKHYDKYETDEERKINCPEGIRYGDWDIFVDNQSTPNAHARRGKGKSAREALKTPHTYGRRGAARTIKTMTKGGANQNHQQRCVSLETSGPGSAIGPQQASSEDLGSSGHKKMVSFNDNGDPVGEGSVSFTSNLGSLTRTHCPVSYEQWRDVPDQIKEMMWELVTDQYLVAAVFKEKILKRISKHWREFKCQLRSKYYDRYNTDEERKRNCPGGVKQKDWDKFVHNQSTANAQARRKRAKSAREALKTPHTSGRRGAARIADDLKKRDQIAVVTGTDMFLGAQSGGGVSFPTQELSTVVEQMKAILAKYPSNTYLGLDDESVRGLSPGREGYAQDSGTGISKRAVLSSTAVRDQLQQVKRMCLSLEGHILNSSEGA